MDGLASELLTRKMKSEELEFQVETVCINFHAVLGIKRLYPLTFCPKTHCQ